MEAAPVQLQMELMDLQCFGTLKQKCNTAGLHASFSPFLQKCPRSVYMQLQPCACLVFRSFLHEKLFSEMETHQQTGVVSLMRSCSPSWESPTQDLNSNTNQLVGEKWCQASGSDKMTLEQKKLDLIYCWKAQILFIIPGFVCFVIQHQTILNFCNFYSKIFG